MVSKLEEQNIKAQEKWRIGWKQGPTRLRWTEIPLQVGDLAKNFTLQDSNGKLVELSSVWTEKPTLIIFLRHYGCSCGMDRVKQLREEFDALKSQGANILLIGQGEPERSAAYAKKYNLPPVPILSDPENKVYQAYGLLEGKPSQIVFDAPEEFLDRDYQAGVNLAKSRKDDDRPLVDNPWLLPGEFVIDTKGIVQLAYRYNYCEDYPDSRVLFSAVREASKADKQI